MFVVLVAAPGGSDTNPGIQTTFAENAPPGFRFMPVGTPELAERCKELSRQRGFAVHVVNVRPSIPSPRKLATNPRQSHHGTWGGVCN